MRLVYEGRIEANRNIEATAKACELLSEQGHEVSYIVIGQIRNRKYLRFISKCAYIRHLPYCEKDVLMNHYRTADVF